MATYDVPGVYMEEQLGPGVIAGVGTSTAAFVGPALRGSLNTPLRISSFDDFLREYAVQASDGQYRPPYIPNGYYLFKVFLRMADIRPILSGWAAEPAQPGK